MNKAFQSFSFKKFNAWLKNPISVLVLLASLGGVSTVFSGWGLWHMADLSSEFKAREDHMLVMAVNIKENVASFSKLTYDFLLQQDFNRMLMKEKQSDATRDEITQDLGTLSMQSDSSTGEVIESVRYNTMQFLTLTDKALEKAVEDGNATSARQILADEAEPALKRAQDSLSNLIQSRQKIEIAHVKFMREQSLMFIILLFGLMTLTMALLMTLRMHFRHPAAASTAVAVVEAKPEPVEIARPLEARSLSTLAIMNRFSRLHKESGDLRKLISDMQRSTGARRSEKLLPMPEAEMKALTLQGERIGQAVSRIHHINDQSKQFLDKLSELMGGMQMLATDGNIVALNVTIELAKLQSQLSDTLAHDKNAKMSEQIRALATSAANITGKMAMILSQFRYAQEDFGRHTAELLSVKDSGNAALAAVRLSLQSVSSNIDTAEGGRAEMESHLPALTLKAEALEQEIEQLQLFAGEELEDSLRDENADRAFRVINGRVA